MDIKKKRPASELDVYTERFESMGIELPEITTANPESVRNVATFLLKHKVFERDEDTLRALVDECAPEAPTDAAK